MKRVSVFLLAAAMLAAGVVVVSAKSVQPYENKEIPGFTIKALGDVPDDSDGTVLFVNKTIKMTLWCLVFENRYNLGNLLRTRVNAPPVLQVIPDGMFEIRPPEVNMEAVKKGMAVPATELLMGYFKHGATYTVLCFSKDFYEGNVVAGVDAITFTARSNVKKTVYQYAEGVGSGGKLERFVNQVVVLPNHDNRPATSSNSMWNNIDVNELAAVLFQKAYGGR